MTHIATASPSQPRTRQNTIVMWVLTGLIAAVMVFHLFTLTRYPVVFIDEGWLGNASYTWITTGVNFDSIHAGTLDQFGYEWVKRFFVGQAPYSAAFAVLGVGLQQSRFVAWLFGVVLIGATIMVSRRLYHDVRIGLIASLLLTLSLPFLQASRYRQDIMLTAFIMLAFWAALVALQDEKPWAHFLAGFLLTISIDIHQTVTVFFPALAALYIVYYGPRFLMQRGTWITAIGAVVGLGLFAAIHILPNPEVYSTLMSFSGERAHLPLTQPQTLIASALGEASRYSFRQNLLDLALIGLGGLLLIWRRSRPDILLLTFTGAAFIGFVLLSGNKTNLYGIHLYPFFMLFVGALVVHLLQHPALIWQRVAVVGLALVILHGGYQIANRVMTNMNYDYDAIIAQIREVIPDGSRIMGMPNWWFGFPDDDYLSSLNITFYDFYNDYTVAEALDIMQPDYIIVDSVQRLVMAEPDEELPESVEAFRIDGPAFAAVLESQGEQVLEFHNQWHGVFQIYRMTWDS